MKRKVLAIVLIVIIALALASWFVNNQFSSLQKQNSELQARNSELENQNGILENQTIWLQDQNQQLQEHLGNYSSPVKIIAFKWQGGYFPVGGLAVPNTASVTIKNYAPVNICGLTLSARLVKNYSGAEISSGDANIDPLGAGELRHINVNVFTTFGNILTHVDCVVTLMSGNTVLDNWTSNIG
jgi:hypothetical protein